MSNRILLALLLCAALLLAVSCAQTETGSEPPTGVLGDDIVWQGKTIAIYREQYDLMVAEQAYRGVPDPEEKALELLLRLEARYQMALAEGFAPDEEAARASVAEHRTTFANPTVAGYESYALFLEALDLTNDQYWEGQYYFLLREPVVAAFVETLQGPYALQNQITAWTESENQQFSDYLDDLTTEYIENDRLL